VRLSTRRTLRGSGVTVYPHQGTGLCQTEHHVGQWELGPRSRSEAWINALD
jgi:hypothetical protein